MPRPSVTTTNEVPVARRTASARAWTVPLRSAAPTACAISGAAATLSATASARSSESWSSRRWAARSASAPPSSSVKTRISAWKAKIWVESPRRRNLRMPRVSLASRLLREFGRVSLGQVDLVALDRGVEGAEHLQHGLGASLRHHAVGAEDRLLGVERLDVLLLADPRVVVGRHLLGDLCGRVRVDVLERLYERVGQLLDGRLVAGDPVVAHIQRRRGIDAAERLHGSGLGAHVDQRGAELLLLHGGDRRLGGH